MCTKRVLLCAKALLHWPHRKGFSPECVFFLPEKVLLQWVHINVFPKCVFLHDSLVYYALRNTCHIAYIYMVFLSVCPYMTFS